MSYVREISANAFPGSRVTASILYPALSRILEARVSTIDPSTTQNQAPPNDLIEAFRKHIYNNMPIRLIHLPEMKLVERSEIFDQTVAQLSFVDERLLSEMKEKIHNIGRTEETSNSESQEEDARENPMKAIYHFLCQWFTRYAVLSHTWLPTGEIIYQDSFQQDWLNLNGPGIEKIKRFCEITHRDHSINLAWIDTLCINKASSAELDESIRSMYKWYANAAICITYLRYTESLNAMESDSWFRRGWTLQELIAPKNMQFYRRDWTRLSSDIEGNDKAHPEIQQIICNATGIEAQELISFDPLTGSDIPTRMRWAASRMTTREEDRAYSLMGIFGVKFSISYGEGAERAFFRLIEAIITSRHTSHVAQVLHWAGNAISDGIHVSRLIPSGPECYNELRVLSTGNKANAIKTEPSFSFSLAEPMILTHLGLRVRLLLSFIPAHKAQKYARASISEPLNMEISPLKNTPTESSLPVLENRSTTPKLLPCYRHQKRGRPHTGGNSFFLGIYTFEEDDYAGCVHVPLTAYAVLLGIARPRAELTMQNVSSKDFGPSSKIDTREPIKLELRPVGDRTQQFNTSPSSFATIMKGSLLKKGMKLVGCSSETPEISDVAKGSVIVRKESLRNMGMKIVTVFL